MSAGVVVEFFTCVCGLCFVCYLLSVINKHAPSQLSFISLTIVVMFSLSMSVLKCSVLQLPNIIKSVFIRKMAILFFFFLAANHLVHLEHPSVSAHVGVFQQCGRATYSVVLNI